MNISWLLTEDNIKTFEPGIYAIFKNHKLITTIQYDDKDTISIIGSDEIYDYKYIVNTYKGLEYTIVLASNVEY